MTISFPAAVNAHSHAFHRLLRGRTHARAGNFWTWRDQMYRAAEVLTPKLYEKLATAVYAEMIVAGYTAVGEFHYLHHRPDGSRYPRHEMELALARAARSAGIRLVLLDTCYLDGGFDPQRKGGRIPANPTQRRFSDGDAAAWLNRLSKLRAVVAEEFDPAQVQVAAAIHSVRAVPPGQLRIIATELDPELALHIHLSEQPKENADCFAATGLTPTGLLAESGLLSARLSAVHATHLSVEDIELLGTARASVVFCPSTEADLADGIGPAHELIAAGAGLALGSDQHAVVDPWLEMRSLEYGERLRSGIRGRFSPEELLGFAHEGGLRSLGLPDYGDQVELNPESVRTVGSTGAQLPMTATAADVLGVRVAGLEIAAAGIHAKLGDPAKLLSEAFAELEGAR